MPSHKPTEESRKTVRTMASFGVPEDAIAKVLSIAPKTLRKHYREDLDTAHIKANVKVAGSLFQQAVSGNTAAAIFWLKARAGWREKHDIDISSSDGSMTPPTRIEIVAGDADDKN